MTAGVKQDRGLIRTDTDECKGCGLCIEACPPKVIALSERLNHYGYRTATYAGSGCTGCGICFLVCPEPGAITVLRLDVRVSRLDPDTSRLLDAGELCRAEAAEIGSKGAAA